MPRYYTREDRERDPGAHARMLAEIAAQARRLYDCKDEGGDDV